jgi:hypothetical protein
MVAIATIVFGAALLIGTMASEYARLIFPAGGRIVSMGRFGGQAFRRISWWERPASCSACSR